MVESVDDMALAMSFFVLWSPAVAYVLADSRVDTPPLVVAGRPEAVTGNGCNREPIRNYGSGRDFNSVRLGLLRSGSSALGAAVKQAP